MVKKQTKVLLLQSPLHRGTPGLSVGTPCVYSRKAGFFDFFYADDTDLIFVIARRKCSPSEHPHRKMMRLKEPNHKQNLSFDMISENILSLLYPFKNNNQKSPFVIVFC